MLLNPNFLALFILNHIKKVPLSLYILERESVHWKIPDCVSLERNHGLIAGTGTRCRWRRKQRCGKRQIERRQQLWRSFSRKLRLACALIAAARYSPSFTRLEAASLALPLFPSISIRPSLSQSPRGISSFMQIKQLQQLREFLAYFMGIAQCQFGFFSPSMLLLDGWCCYVASMLLLLLWLLLQHLLSSCPTVEVGTRHLSSSASSSPLGICICKIVVYLFVVY